MKSVTFLNLDSTPYENGKKSGEYFKDKVKIDIKNNLKIIESNVNLRNRVENIFNQIKVKYNTYYNEIIGKADGLEIDRLVYFSILCPELLELGFEHCTTIICKKKNGYYIISHNEDDEYIEGNFCLSKVKIDDDNWFVTNDMYNMPFGNGFSWNSYGIFKTINYCHEENFNLDYLPRYFSQRHISEASSIEDLVKRCKEMKIASGYHVNAIDINNNKAVSIEVYNDKIDVEYIDDYYIHSNHYIHGKNIYNQLTDKDSNSVFRLEKATSLLKQADRNIDDIKKILSYRSDLDIFSESILQTKDDPYMTIANISFDTENKDDIILNTYVSNEIMNLKYDIYKLKK